MADYTLSAGGSLKFKGEIKDNCNNTSYKGTWSISGDTSYFTKSDNSSDNTTTITQNGNFYECNGISKNITLTWTSSENSLCSTEISINRYPNGPKYKIEIIEGEYQAYVYHESTIKVQVRDIQTNNLCGADILNNVVVSITDSSNSGIIGTITKSVSGTVLTITYKPKSPGKGNSITFSLGDCANSLTSNSITSSPYGGWRGTDNGIDPDYSRGEGTCEPIRLRYISDSIYGTETNGEETTTIYWTDDSFYIADVRDENGIITREDWEKDLGWCKCKWVSNIEGNTGLCNVGYMLILFKENTGNTVRKASFTLYAPSNTVIMPENCSRYPGAKIRPSWEYSIWQAPKGQHLIGGGFEECPILVND